MVYVEKKREGGADEDDDIAARLSKLKSIGK